MLLDHFLEPKLMSSYFLTHIIILSNMPHILSNYLMQVIAEKADLIPLTVI